MMSIFNSKIELKDVKTKVDLLKLKRTKKSQLEIDKTLGKVEANDEVHRSQNFSSHDLTNVNLFEQIYVGKNFSHCDFLNADLKGCIFFRCNFSYCVNMKKALIDKDTQLKECNLCTTDFTKEDNVKYKKIKRETEKLIKALELKYEAEKDSEKKEEIASEIADSQDVIVVAENALIRDCNVIQFTDEEINIQFNNIEGVK